MTVGAAARGAARGDEGAAEARATSEKTASVNTGGILMAGGDVDRSTEERKGS